MDISQLNEFVVLAQCLNFTESAKRLHITQPTLTKHIQDLEATVGSKLFYRSTQEVQLTSSGRLFFEGAVSILETYNDMLAEINISKNAVTITIGGMIENSKVRSILGKTSHQIHSKNGNVQLRQIPSDYHTPLFSYLKNDKTDILISFLKRPQWNTDIKSHALFSDKAYAIVSATSNLRDYDELTISDVCGNPIVRLTGNYYRGGWLTIKQAFDNANCNYTSSPTLISSPSELSFLNLSNEVFIISETSLEGQPFLNDYNYCAIPFDPNSLKFTMYALAKKNSKSEEIDLVIESLIENSKAYKL